jgi:hypothetical protein
MHGIRHELPHNTPEQVREYLSAALEIVAELDPPTDLRVTAFDKAVNLLAAKQIGIEQVQPGMPTMAIPRGR